MDVTTLLVDFEAEAAPAIAFVKAIMNSSQFWFGAFLLALHNIGAFSKVSPSNFNLITANAPLATMRAYDYVGHTLYGIGLIGFLITTVMVYLFLCAVSPTIVDGWFLVTHQSNHLDPAFYPLYIAALLMGLTGAVIPGLASMGDLQRDFFQSLIGVPEKLIRLSGSYYNQIISRCDNDREKLATELETLLDDPWIAGADNFIDTGFYRSEINHLKLDNDQEKTELSRSSRREMERTLDSLLYAVCRAAVKRKGYRGLRKLASYLDLENPKPNAGASSSQILIAAIVAVFVWSLIPTLHMTVKPLFHTHNDLWPDNTKETAQYIIEYAMPIFLSVSITSIWLSRSEDQKRPPFRTFGPLFTLMGCLVIGFDIFQAFFDFGQNEKISKNISSASTFLSTYVPIYVLHYIIVATVIWFIILLNFSRSNTDRAVGILVIMPFCVFVATLPYVVIRPMVQWSISCIDQLDLTVLVIAMNLIFALAAAIPSYFLYDRIQQRAGVIADEQAITP